ncbi:Receptor expression-enhancing protein 4 [Frankliniella fusca]|uniref:Receptor expression-enhancing protein 4 n=1 Tax=Frankliniella fusca TaxID=407009 RepID=A0AAE1L7J6_9NEOP|nr:Receptor expression-enhancing protein 4 [Frankliniella fusca]
MPEKLKDLEVKFLEFFDRNNIAALILAVSPQVRVDLLWRRCVESIMAAKAEEHDSQPRKLSRRVARREARRGVCLARVEASENANLPRFLSLPLPAKSAVIIYAAPRPRRRRRLTRPDGCCCGDSDAPPPRRHQHGGGSR